MTDVFFNIYIYICIYESRSKSFVYDLCRLETLRKFYRIKTCKTRWSRKQRVSLRKRMRTLTCVLGMPEWLDRFFCKLLWDIRVKNNTIMCLPNGYIQEYLFGIYVQMYNMCLYMYIYTNSWHIYTYTYTYICIHIYICSYIYIYIHISIRIPFVWFIFFSLEYLLQL